MTGIKSQEKWKYDPHTGHYELQFSDSEKVIFGLGTELLDESGKSYFLEYSVGSAPRGLFSFFPEDEDSNECKGDLDSLLGRLDEIKMAEGLGTRLRGGLASLISALEEGDFC